MQLNIKITFHLWLSQMKYMETIGNLTSVLFDNLIRTHYAVPTT